MENYNKIKMIKQHVFNAYKIGTINTHSSTNYTLDKKNTAACI